MEAKDAPDSTKIKLTADATDQNAVDPVEGPALVHHDDVDSAAVADLAVTDRADDLDPTNDVVRPFIADDKNAHSEAARRTIFGTARSEPSRKQPLEAKHFFRVKQLGMIMGMVLAVSLGAAIWHQRNVDEDQLSYYRDQAELAESNPSYTKASSLWQKALRLSTSLHSDRRSLADLHMRAATAEFNAVSEIERSQYNPDMTIKASSTKLKEEYEAASKKDLLDALHIYKRIANTRSEQMVALTNIVEIINYPLPECDDNSVYWDGYASPPFYRDHDSLHVTERNSNFEIIAEYKNYLLRRSNPYTPAIGMPALFRRIHTGGEWTKLIAVLDELVYHMPWSGYFLEEHKWLDGVIVRSGRNADPNGRLALGNEAYERGDLHAAIVEYSRYLGSNKTDERIREKLLQVRRLNRQKTVGSGPDPLLESAGFLKELRTLQAQTYGNDNSETIRTTVKIAVSLAKAEDLDGAERELAPVLAKLEKSASMKATLGKDDQLATDADDDPTDYDKLNVFRVASHIAAQKAMYESAARLLEQGVRASGQLHRTALIELGPYYANLLTSQGLYDRAHRQLELDVKARSDYSATHQPYAQVPEAPSIRSD